MSGSLLGAASEGDDVGSALGCGSLGVALLSTRLEFATEGEGEAGAQAEKSTSTAAQRGFMVGPAAWFDARSAPR